MFKSLHVAKLCPRSMSAFATGTVVFRATLKYLPL